MKESLLLLAYKTVVYISLKRK